MSEEEYTSNYGVGEELVERPILEHLRELKSRVIYAVLSLVIGSFIAYYFAEDIYSFLIEPLAKASPDNQRRMIYTSLTEAFVTYLKLAIFAGFVFSFPVIFYQIYAFIAPGLYKKEKRFFLPIFIASPALFLVGAAFVYYFLLPTAWQFFLSFETTNSPLPIELEAKIADYLSLVTSLIIAFGVSFQLPIVMILLVTSGLVTVESLTESRKYAVILMLILAAILTPPDVISQLSLFIPLYFLYEATIIICRIINKNNKYKEKQDA